MSRVRVDRNWPVSQVALLAVIVTALGVVGPPASSAARGVCAPSWQSVPTADPGRLTAVAALSPTDAWAVGEANLTQRWDGEKWTVVGLADPRRVLKSVAIASPAATWVVGYQAPRAAFDTYANRTPVIERWDGMVWHVERAPGFHGRGGWLNGVAAIAPDN